MLAKLVYEHIRPSGWQRPRIYGLPKTHKKDVPFRHMVGSAQHELAKFLLATLQPVLDLYSSNCTKDSFSFAQKVQQLEFNPDHSFLCSYDIFSLFTNVPLAETIQICADTLYNGQLPPPQFSRKIFIELINVATKSVKFSFNNVMHKQADEVAMGSPLGPALADIFVGYYKNKLFTSVEKLLLYTRYVDDTFAIFHTRGRSRKIFYRPQLPTPSSEIYLEKEVNQTLPFLDVKIEKENGQFLTSIYRKSSFTSQYICCDSFGPSKRKINLIGTLVHRAPVICSISKLQQELD